MSTFFRLLTIWIIFQVNAYLERKSLSHSFNDTKTSIKQLHQIANAIVIVIMIIVILLVLRIATSHVILLLSSQLVLESFIFWNSCKTVIFLSFKLALS